RYDCWTFVELAEGRPARVSLELLAKGRELSGKLGGDNVALVFGPDVSTGLARHGADRVVLVDGLDEYDPHSWAAALRQVVEQRRPHVLLIPATANGRDLGPRVAGELELGMTGDCVGLNIDRAGRLIQTKPAYGGNIVSVIMGATTPQLATVRPRMFEPLEPRDVDAVVERLELGDLEPRHTRLIERTPVPARDLDEADVVVCLGSELPSEDIETARALAESGGSAAWRSSGSRATSASWRRRSAVTATPTGNRRGRSRRTPTTSWRRSTASASGGPPSSVTHTADASCSSSRHSTPVASNGPRC